MSAASECCKETDNYKIVWAMNIFEDWEIEAVYCKVCGEILEENNINRGC